MTFRSASRSMARRLVAAASRDGRRPTVVIDQRDPVALEIQEVLDDDLRSGAALIESSYRSYAMRTGSLDGYCAAAAAAYFHLQGGRAAGLQPRQFTAEDDGRHWWIVRGDDVVVDLVLRPDDEPTYRHYRDGRPRGFTNAGYLRPPDRAAEIMRRVIERRRAAAAE